MNKEFIEKVKDEITKKINFQNDIKRKIDEIDKLKENEYVKRYMELEKYDTTETRNFASKSIESIEEDAIVKYFNNFKSTNEIYFCVAKCYYGHKKIDGSYYIDNYSEGSIPVAFYADIENFTNSYIIPVYECEKFEREHKVIFPKEPVTPLSEYHDIQKNFFSDAIDNGQDTALVKLLTKYKIKSPNL